MTVKDWLGENNQLGQDIWQRKYRHNNESFEEWLDRVSAGDNELRKLIIEKKFLMGGRTLANRGLNNTGSLFNCYSRGYIEDDYYDIMDAAKDIGITFKAQGGQGISLTKLRPKGTPIKTEYYSDGIVPFMKIFNEVTAGTSQGGARKGALMLSIDARHKEAETFIKIKSKEGEIEKANLSLELDDEFMRAVEKYYDTGEVVTLHEKRNYSGHEIEYDVTPIEIFKMLVDNCYDWADPACLFTNKFRNYNLMQFDEDYEIETCNPSLRAGTLILTNNGPVPIETLEGTRFKTYNINGELSDAECFLSGKHKQLYKITLDNGESYYCTPEHKWPVLDKDGLTYNKKLTTDIKIGDYLPLNSNINTLSNGTLGSYEDGLFCGLWYGDGSKTIRKDDGRPQYSYTCGADDAEVGILDFIKIKMSNITGKNINYYTRNRGKQNWYEFCCGDRLLHQFFQKFGVDNKKSFPALFYTECSENFRRGFISGLISADGSVNIAKKGERITLTTVNETIAKQFSNLMWWYGIRNNTTKIVRNLSIENHPSKEYTRYDVNISRGMFKKFHELFKIYHKHKETKICNILSTNKRYSRLTNNIKIVNIELTDVYEDVWDIHVYDDTHTFPLNYCITGNCGEQPLPKHGACCLSSLNLSEFIVNPYTPQAHLNTADLLSAIDVGIRTLDKLIDENYNRHPLQQQRDMSYNYRNIGLGIFGYATALMKLGLRYGSPEAIEFTDDVFSLIFRRAVLASNELAKEFGPYPKYKEEIFDSDIIKFHFSPDEITKLKEYGLRNCSLVSIAPTGSLATLLGESGGCEPEFALKYTRRTVGMTDGEDTYYDVYCKAAREYMEINNTKELPDYFVGSADISWQSRVLTQAVMQKHVDTAISSTVNMPNSATKDDIAHMYLLAWSSGCKGITMFRDGCKRLGILTTGNKKEEEISHKELKRGEIMKCADDLIGKKRKIINGCGSTHVLGFFEPVYGDLVEVFFTKGSLGGCSNYMVGLSRMVSLACRAGVSINDIQDQLNSTGACPSYAIRTATKHDTSKGACCPMAIGNALMDMWKEVQEELGYLEKPEKKKSQKFGERCPECGAVLEHSGGCDICKECGYSHCN